MKRLFLKVVAVGVLLVMISGCATTDAGRTKAEGTGFGTLLGAALGAGIGALVGGKDGAVAGAIVGAAAGGAGGYAVGSSVAERKQDYVNAEDQLDGKIDVIAGYNSDLEIYNQKTAMQIEQLEKQVADLKSSYDAGSVQVSALEEKQGDINSLISEAEKRKDSMDNELAALDEYRQSIDQTQDQAKVAKLGDEIDTLKKNIAMLDDGNKQMAQLVSSLTLSK